MNKFIYEIYKLAYNSSAQRGGKKQDKINEAIKNFLGKEEKFQKSIFKDEFSVPSYFGDSESFRVDVAAFNEIGEIQNLALGKAVSSSIAKNKKNLLKTMVGEIQEPKSDSPMTFVTFLPKNTPIFEKSGNIKSFESNKVEFIYKSPKQIFPRDFDEFYFIFDIEGISNCKTREDVEKLFQSSNPIKNIEIYKNSYKKLNNFNEQEKK